jgi:hypothetical protein
MLETDNNNDYHISPEEQRTTQKKSSPISAFIITSDPNEVRIHIQLIQKG